VTSYPRGVSPAGLRDGSGNVWEWMGEIEASGRVPLRGGSWNDYRRLARVSYRIGYHPYDFDVNVGFRLVVAPVFP
jgi:formylglycine-generating enzyme required for sulfatase activity